MHAKPDLRVLLEWMIAGSGSVITDVIRLDRSGHPIVWQALIISVVLVAIVLLVLFVESLPHAISAVTEKWAKRLREAWRYRSALIVSWGYHFWWF